MSRGGRFGHPCPFATLPTSCGSRGKTDDVQDEVPRAQGCEGAAELPQAADKDDVVTQHLTYGGGAVFETREVCREGE